MAPNICYPTGVLHETDEDLALDAVPAPPTKPDDRKLELVWRNIILFAYLHLAALYGVWLMFTSAKLATSVLGKNIFRFLTRFLPFYQEMASNRLFERLSLF